MKLSLFEVLVNVLPVVFAIVFSTEKGLKRGTFGQFHTNVGGGSC